MSNISLVFYSFIFHFPFSPEMKFGDISTVNKTVSAYLSLVLHCGVNFAEPGLALLVSWGLVNITETLFNESNSFVYAVDLIA